MILKISNLFPIPQADTYFIDDSSNGVGGIQGPDSHQLINAASSAQQVELFWFIYYD